MPLVSKEIHYDGQTIHLVHVNVRQGAWLKHCVVGKGGHKNWHRRSKILPQIRTKLVNLAAGEEEDDDAAVAASKEDPMARLASAESTQNAERRSHTKTSQVHNGGSDAHCPCAQVL